MTPEERAKKICKLIIHNWIPDGDDVRIQAIADQIREAVEEVTGSCDRHRAKAYKEGFQQGLEDAAKIAEGIIEHYCCTEDCQAFEVADKIRARAKEIK